jgi:hypothetical protein
MLKNHYYKGATAHNAPKKYKTLADILANTTPVSTCMEWKGAMNGDGYPACGVGGLFQSQALHREVFALVFGTRPEVVMHTCDNPRCINPDHLKAGNSTLNITDRDAKGRQATGERNGNVKLTAAQVQEIRALHAAKISYLEIAARYGIARVTVWRVTAGKNWGAVCA